MVSMERGLAQVYCEDADAEKSIVRIVANESVQVLIGLTFDGHTWKTTQRLACSVENTCWFVLPKAATLGDFFGRRL